jgi:(2Fe-2S) ferredoxin
MKTKKKSRHNNTTKKCPIRGTKTMNEKWIIVELYGNAYERGFTHGYLLAKELDHLKNVFPTIVKQEMNNETIHHYLERANRSLIKTVQTKFPEIYRELQGIVQGALYNGTIISLEFLIGWNAFSSFSDTPDRCSAFIATGEITKNGEIVMAHNTHINFLIGQFYNVVFKIFPKRGFDIVMQSMPGLVWSSSDWFLTSAGIVGCETTIGNISYEPNYKKSPSFCRVRMATQYGSSLDDYVTILKKDNAGDYANSWLLGDIQNGEIMRFEMTKTVNSVEKTKNGAYFGANDPFSLTIRKKETTQKEGFGDNRFSSGMRTNRLNQLLYETYYGKVDRENAQKIIADHYDKGQCSKNGCTNTPNSRTICKHDDENMFGAIDGKVLTTESAKKMRFYGRFGASCGQRHFRIAEYCKHHPNETKMETMISNIFSGKWIYI